MLIKYNTKDVELLARLMRALNLVEDEYKAEEPAPEPEEPKEYILPVEH